MAGMPQGIHGTYLVPLSAFVGNTLFVSHEDHKVH